MFLDGFLGIKSSPGLARQLVYRYLTIQVIAIFLFNLSSTFWILFAIDRIGFAFAGFFISFMFFVQLVFDYPSGSLGDWLGQRWVLVLSYSGYAASFYLLTVAQTFPDFLIIAAVNGFANAQSSGTISSWLDSNYRKAAGNHDEDRKTYGFFLARIQTLERIGMSLAFIIGGMLATTISRELVFSIQFWLIVTLIILTVLLVKDVTVATDDINVGRSEKLSIKEYLVFFKGGIRFLFSSRVAFFFLAGLAIYNVTWSVWGNLILFPMYFGYSGSDSMAALLRTGIFVLGLPVGYYVANLSKKFSNESFPQFYYLHAVIFFPVFILLLTLLPVNDRFNLLGFTLVIIFQISLNTMIFRTGDILRQRVMLDLIPSENRNAIYSLIPTIFSLFSIPALSITGVLIENHGLTAGIAAAGLVAFTGTTMITLSLHFKQAREKDLQKAKSPEKEGSPVAG